MKKIVIAIVSAISAALLITACSSAPSEPTVNVSESSYVIDVRTPGEFSEGHLDGANLLDLNSGEFASVLPSLDPSAEYFVYCRSGNRSSQAVQLMKSAGFTNVTDLGSIQSASSATGIPIIK